MNSYDTLGIIWGEFTSEDGQKTVQITTSKDVSYFNIPLTANYFVDETSMNNCSSENHDSKMLGECDENLFQLKWISFWN